MPNIFAQIPKQLQAELFEEIARGDSFRLERIISQGHATPESQWYDQEQEEWVILLQGGAGIQVEGEPEEIILKPGDYRRFRAHERHRVQWTQAGVETVWLALHYQSKTD